MHPADRHDRMGANARSTVGTVTDANAMLRAEERQR
jgi:excinuclease UvrABC ATPase subunit